MMEGTARYACEDGTWFIKLMGAVCHPLGPALNALLDRALAGSGSGHFVIDLTGAEMIDSTCLGILTRLATQRTASDGIRPVIITGGGTIAKNLLVVCFDRLFELVDSADSAPRQLRPAPAVTLEPDDMLTLLLDAHRRLCAIDTSTHAVFQDVVEALETDALIHCGKTD